MTADASASGTAWTDDDAFVAELEACLRLRHAPGIGPRTWKRIFDRYPSAREAVADARNFGPQGLCEDAAAAGLRHGPATDDARREIDAAANKGLLPLPYFHPAFPPRLRELPDPPVVLYVVGEARLLTGPCMAMVGARQCSRYGFATAHAIAAGLSAAGITVVSGLAYGIDRQAHLGGLTGPGRSIAVCGTGLDLVYPDANLDVWRALAATGAVVSEFPPGTPPRAQNFPIRNRIIAGMSLGVLVVEAAARSGSLITARLALDQGREVFALPGPVNLPTFAGCHALIAQGARLVQTAEDIVTTLALELTPFVEAPRPAPPTVAVLPSRGAAPDPAPADVPSPAPPSEALSPLEAAVMETLADGAKHHIDALARSLATASEALSRTLVLLELRGLVRKWPGMYYTRELEG